ALFDVAGHPAAVTICYEDAFGQELLDQLPQAQLLINISEDGWFGHSIGPLQRVQMAQMRALETGRPVLRVANTGVTALIDPHGRIVSSLPQYQEGVLTVSVQPMSGATPYVRWGNRPVLVVVLALLVVLLLFRRSARKIERGARQNPE
ncbi:MAG: apolipoprotein N-acyltransferase, partial [Gammaproteobacteria bacterium]